MKLFLPRGDAKSLRTAEISNWTGKAVAAPERSWTNYFAREEYAVNPDDLQGIRRERCEQEYTP
jgi:hypothetical protein